MEFFIGACASFGDERGEGRAARGEMRATSRVSFKCAFFGSLDRQTDRRRKWLRAAQSGRQSVKRNHAEEECGNPEDATGWDAGLRAVDVNAADGAEARSPARKRAAR